MMPLNLAPTGEENIILRVSGSADVKQHLQDIGFVPGGKVTVISSNGSGIIVNVKGVRIAVTREMATKIFV
ncbi:MAG: ferrous iron transport protein A [Firmicutes bacterium]|nr:ferrous iron transport protein A [Bacillota bacterium]